jgi:hypothetical protein
VFGYCWVVMLTNTQIGAGLSLERTLLLANGLVVLWLLVYFVLLATPPNTPGAAQPIECHAVAVEVYARTCTTPLRVA